jgi:hypothetical protein
VPLLDASILASSCSLHEYRYARKLRRAVAARVDEYGPAARARLVPWFAAAGLAYPPHSVVLAVFKQDRQLQLYAADELQAPRFIRAYPVLGASGTLGPKLAEGDRQVPEGLYRIELLNPFSRHHLSLRLDYPNEFDRARAEEDGRSDLGGDIMIHGSSGSTGCIAIGDVAVEDLFVLAADVGMENVAVLVSPVDFRVADAPAALDSPSWVAQLYARLREAVWLLPMPPLAVGESGTLTDR